MFYMVSCLVRDCVVCAGDFDFVVVCFSGIVLWLCLGVFVVCFGGGCGDLVACWAVRRLW